MRSHDLLAAQPMVQVPLLSLASSSCRDHASASWVGVHLSAERSPGPQCSTLMRHRQRLTRCERERAGEGRVPGERGRAKCCGSVDHSLNPGSGTAAHLRTRAAMDVQGLVGALDGGGLMHEVENRVEWTIYPGVRRRRAHVGLRSSHIAGSELPRPFLLLYPSPDDPETDLSALLTEVMRIVLPHIRDHIWQRDAFVLHSSKEDPRSSTATSSGEPPHLWGAMRFGDNIDDEWFVVWLLLEASRHLPTLSVRCAPQTLRLPGSTVSS